MNGADLDRLTRWRATTRTWFRKTAHLIDALHSLDPRKDARWLLGYEASLLLDDVLEYGSLLAAVLADDDQVEVCLRSARELVTALEARSKVTRRARLAGKLANVEGRTPEEAALFAAKALELGS